MALTTFTQWFGGLRRTDRVRQGDENTTDPIEVMDEANRIIEDFPLKKYALYAILFLVEIALCFWIALSL